MLRLGGLGMRPIRRQLSSLVALNLLSALLLVACGVAIPPADITATAQSSDRERLQAVLPGEPTRTASDLSLSQQLPQATPAPSPASADAAAATAMPASAALRAPGAEPTSTIAPTATEPLPEQASPTSEPPPPTPAAAVTAPADPGAEALAILNDYRTRQGLSPLRYEGSLAAAAANYARLMADNGWFGHDGPDGSTPQSRIAAAGYSGRFKGEALAGGQGSAAQVVNTWLNSPPHAAILLDPSAGEIGVGYAYNRADAYGHYWVVDTGTP